MIARRFNAARKGDGERIREICEVLGATLADVQGDYEAYQRMPALVEHAAEYEDLSRRARDLGNKLRAKRAELKSETQRLQREARALDDQQKQVVHQLQQAADAARQVPAVRERHWRIFGTKPTIAPQHAGRGGEYPCAAVEAWLADEPERVVFPHDGDPGTVEILRDRGYVPTSEGLWSRVEETDDGPQAPE